MYITTKSGTIVAGRVNKVEYKEVGEKKTPIIEFSIPIDIIGADGNKETKWFNCQAFNPIATRFRGKLNKGDSVLIRGSIRFPSEKVFEYDFDSKRYVKSKGASLQGYAVEKNISVVPNASKFAN